MMADIEGSGSAAASSPNDFSFSFGACEGCGLPYPIFLSVDLSNCMRPLPQPSRPSFCIHCGKPSADSTAEGNGIAARPSSAASLGQQRPASPRSALRPPPSSTSSRAVLQEDRAAPFATQQRSWAAAAVPRFVPWEDAAAAFRLIAASHEKELAALRETIAKGHSGIQVKQVCRSSGSTKRQTSMPSSSAAAASPSSSLSSSPSPLQQRYPAKMPLHHSPSSETPRCRSKTAQRRSVSCSSSGDAEQQRMAEYDAREKHARDAVPELRLPFGEGRGATAQAVSSQGKVTDGRDGLRRLLLQQL